jgi:nucleoside phosphorylase
MAGHRGLDFKVGWICATSIELAMATEMLDEEYDLLPQTPGDDNIYTLGRIGVHHVAVACLPAGQRGTGAATVVASQMWSSFKSLRFCLLVGIGGGAPSTERDVRLGDVVVSQPDRQFGGVVQYDLGKREADGRFVRTGSLNAPPAVLLAALQKLKANHYRGIRKSSDYLNRLFAKDDFGVRQPSNERDRLFRATYEHVGGHNCDGCSTQHLVSRGSRDEVVVHYGTIASGNQDIQDGLTRQRLSDDLGGVLCFEMEAAGLMNGFPCLVIRGICDYSDSHRNDYWHEYAAATAAAYAKELLSIIPAQEVIKTETIEQAITAERRECIFLVSPRICSVLTILPISKTRFDDPFSSKRECCYTGRDLC